MTLNGAVTVSGANTFTSGTGNVTLNGSTSIANGKTLTVGTGTAIKAIELGTCTNANNAQTTCSTANGNTTGITLANIVATDSITISAQGAATNGRPCVVDTITAGASFRIDCTANPGNGLVWNVLVVRR